MTENKPPSAQPASNTEKTLIKKLLKRIYVKTVRFLLQKDTPHRTALGLALGIFVGLLPIMGIQMAVVAAIAIPLRGNIKAAIAGVWISNPVTFIPMYWGFYRLGLLITPGRRVDKERFFGIVTHAFDWSFSEIAESINRLLHVSGDILIPLWIGALILAVGLGIPTYFATYWLIVKYRASRTKKISSQTAR